MTFIYLSYTLGSWTQVPLGKKAFLDFFCAFLAKSTYDKCLYLFYQLHPFI